jgi:cysteine desulfurase
MLPWLGEVWGNPSSGHRPGLAAARAVKQARALVAEALGCAPDELVFTAGGTEADVLALKGVCWAARAPGHLVISAIEHPAVRNAAQELESEGWRLDIAPVDSRGLVSPEALAALVGPDTVLVSIMHVNNEIGTVQPIAELARAAKRANERSLFHTDAVQAFTKVPVGLRDLGVDLLSVSSHKIHGPMGVGALAVRSGVRIRALFSGGGQEGGRRSGTENVPGLVGFSTAARLGTEGLAAEAAAIRSRRDQLQSLVVDRVADVDVNGADGPARACNNLHLSVRGVASQPLLHALEARGIHGSAGSACHSKETRLSHVLQAIGAVAEGWGHIRLTLSRYTTDEEVEAAADAFEEAVAGLRR